MIIVKLWGGLGNQMFQYAAARRLAHVNAEVLKLDTRWFGKEAPGDTARRYELDVFTLVADNAAADDSDRLRGRDTRRWPKIVKRLMNGIGYAVPSSYITEKHFHFNPEILQITGDAYLDGYWQSEKYFRDAAEIIRSDFQLVAEPQGMNRETLTMIEESNSVSIHVRRGDYITNASAAAYHGTLPLDYYHAALQTVQERVENPHLFVFSDDPGWVKDHLQTSLPVVYVEGNGARSASEDLRLMSVCKHHIVANSSFSWWGAWLGSARDSVVVAPERWFSDQVINTADLVPEGWLRL